MRPSQTLLNLTLIWLGLAVLVFVARVLDESNSLNLQQVASQGVLPNTIALIWRWLGMGLAVVAVIDVVKHRNFEQLTLKRELPHSLALGVPANIKVTITNPYQYTLSIEFTDLYPSLVQVQTLPLRLQIAAESNQTINYPIVPMARGEAHFGASCLRVTTPWRLWQRRVDINNDESVKIYPNFAPIVNSASIGLEQQIAQMGIHLQHRRGQGSDFHQLREFREGDSLRQIDWKATARQRKPISREYQDERDQDIMFLIDGGRRLRAKDDDISHFDHALNAVLLTSYIALRQGDAVGLMSFAGDERWLLPKKGPSSINAILNQLYDLHSSTETSDFLYAAEAFSRRYSKRSLVVIVTNLWEEDVDDLLAAIGLLKKKHIVLLANLRENYLDESVQQAVQNFEQALSYCSTTDYLARRRKVFAQLKNSGAIITDSSPQSLHINLVNEYLKLKRSGLL